MSDIQSIRHAQVLAGEQAVIDSLPPALRKKDTRGELAAVAQGVAGITLVEADMVNHPPHYTAGKVECIDALEAATTGLTGIDAVCTAAAIKYLWRWKFKGGPEDLKKARWYINRLLGDAS